MAGLGSHLKEQWNELTREQQLAVSVFGVMSLALLVFGVIQLRAGIIGPFTTPVQTLVDLRETIGPTQEELIREQQTTDTDGDGISNYDESTKYATSPYVRDSDSDGDADNVEIAKGTDPNCAKGTTCTAAVNGTETATSSSGGFQGLPGAGFGADVGTSLDTSVELPARDAAAIRAYLQESGVSAADLAGYTDAEIIQAYDQAAGGQVGSDSSSP